LATIDGNTGDGMRVEDVIDLWGGKRKDFAKSCGVSANTVYNWVQAGCIPKSKRAELQHEIVPKQRERIERMAQLEKALDEEFSRGLFDEK
jgi:transposase